VSVALLTLLAPVTARAQVPGAASPARLTTPTEPEASSTVSSRWSSKIYGFVEIDVVRDSTQAFPDLGGWVSTAIPKSTTYAGSRGRTQASARNTRLGLLMEAPRYAGIGAIGTLEADFMGAQSADTSELGFTSALLRLRVASLLLKNRFVDVELGQGWVVFGFQPFFLPASPFLLPVPGEVFKRDVQLKLSRTFTSRPVDFQIAASANRPPQRDSELPDVHAGVRLTFNGWKGAHTPGSDGQRLVGGAVDGLTLAVSAAGRRFRVTDFEGTAAGTYPDPKSSSPKNGFGIVADALLPIIPASSLEDRGNALTAIGQFSLGSGYADLLGGLVSNLGGPASGAAPYPAVPNSPDRYAPNIAPGLVTYDNTGKLHTIDWQTFLVGMQYYLPPAGNVFVAASYAEARSKNVADWADPGQVPLIFDKTRYFDASLFWDIVPAVRVAGSYQYLQQRFANGDKAHNDRVELSGYYWF
jgi:hypothetical protein